MEYEKPMFTLMNLDWYEAEKHYCWTSQSVPCFDTVHRTDADDTGSQNGSQKSYCTCKYSHTETLCPLCGCWEIAFCPVGYF